MEHEHSHEPDPTLTSKFIKAFAVIALMFFGLTGLWLLILGVIKD